ncbi:MAG: hypothetical protein RBT01_16695 [Anaerolineaceae bacterium]|nr:hypothetical protein [Anaerolineaceae bacterium]
MSNAEGVPPEDYVIHYEGNAYGGGIIQNSPCAVSINSSAHPSLYLG